MSESEKPQIYQFGEFQLNLAEESLHRNGAKIGINRKTFQVLKLLVERAGEIISKQEFFETVWTDAFVEDNVLTVTMTALRKILSDNPKEPKFVENVPRKGYRFIAAVEVCENQPEVETPKIENPAADATIEKPDGGAAADFQPLLTDNRQPSSKIRRFFPIGVFGVCLLILFVVVGFNYFNSKSPKIVQNAAPQIESIAVLPFENMNPDIDYLSDGLTESVIDELNGLPNLRVISRNSVFEYKNKATDLAEVGRALNVQTILTGEIFGQGDDEILINVKLIDLPNNRQIWKGRYARRTSDEFAVKQEIARDVIGQLRSNLTDAERQNLAGRETDNAEAFRLFLKGRYEWNKRTNAGFAAALGYFNQAVEKDATYALAYDGIANCYMANNVLETDEERSALSKAVAQRALEIDPNLGEAYATLAFVSYYYDWNWQQADQEFQQALKLSPNYATAHHWYAEFLATEGRFDESFAEYERALALDPLSLAIQTDLGMNYYYARQDDRAIEQLEKIKARNPDFLRTYIFLSEIYETKGIYQESIEEFDRAVGFNGANAQYLAVRKTILENALRTAGAKGYWTKLRDNPQDITRGILGQALAAGELGETDKAFEMLSRLATLNKSRSLVWLKVSPKYDKLRSDSRFADLVRRVGIP